MLTFKRLNLGCEVCHVSSGPLKSVGNPGGKTVSRAFMRQKAMLVTSSRFLSCQMHIISGATGPPTYSRGIAKHPVSVGAEIALESRDAHLKGQAVVAV